MTRSPATCPSTPPPARRRSVADAFADPFVELDPVANTLAPAPTVSPRALDADTNDSQPSPQPRRRPLGARDTDPFAVVSTEAVCVAAARGAAEHHRRTRGDAAVLVTVESETATDGAIETPPRQTRLCGRGHRVRARRQQAQIVRGDRGADLDSSPRDVGDEIQCDRGADTGAGRTGGRLRRRRGSSTSREQRIAGVVTATPAR